MKVIEAGIFEVKTHLSEFIEKVESGQTFLITKRGKPVAELRPPGNRTVARPRRGHARGDLREFAADFDAPMEDFKEYME
jgi:antitoxin (DNA-binding transcriptional repressor) of toxin-antitoxin stability system